MRAIMLAAGASTRLYPLTINKPKSLLLIEDKTILHHQLERLAAAGITELIIVVGCQKEQIIQNVTEARQPFSVTYVHNDSFSSTRPILGGLLPAIDYFDQQVLFFHCDVLFGSETLPKLLNDTHETALLYRRGSWDEEAGKIIVDASGRVIELGKHISRERASGEYLQIAKFGKEFCEGLAKVVRERARSGNDGYTIDAFNDVVQDTGIKAYGIPFSGIALEIDTPDDFASAKKIWAMEQ